MSQPLALVGPATLEVIGFNPQGFGWEGEANIAAHPVFDSDIYYQPVSGGEEVETLHVACRPHVFGGLGNYEALKGIMKSRKPVPYIRMSGLVGGYRGLVLVRRVSKDERKIAPDGAGWRWEFMAELVFAGASGGGGGW
jgi:phage protein U